MLKQAGATVKSAPLPFGPGQEGDREPRASAKRHSLAIMNLGVGQREREHDGRQCLGRTSASTGTTTSAKPNPT